MDNVTGLRKNAPPRSRPRDAESFAAEAKFRARLAELGATLLEPDWLTKGKPHHCRCAAGHDCYPLPANVNRGAGICRVCVGSDPAAAEAKFRAKIAELGGVVVGEYRDTKTAVHVRDAAGHDSYPTPDKIRDRGIPCRICSGRPDGAMAEAAFRARLAELGVTLLEPAWLGATARHRSICRSGHVGAVVPATIKRGALGCLVCVGLDSAVAEVAFRAKVAELGGVILGEYTNAHGKVRVRCPAGHDCHPTPHSVERVGTIGCPTCSGIVSAAWEAKYGARLAELGATPMYEKWLGSGQPHAAQCGAGHACTPRPADVLQGCGVCRVCKGMAWDVFYVVTSADVVKFGVTSGDPRRRLRTHLRDGLSEVVRLVTGIPGAIALNAERAVKAALALADEKPIQGREYFDISCLALVLDVADSWLSIPGEEAEAVRLEIAREWVQDDLFAA